MTLQPNITLLIASSDDINLDIQLRHEPGHSLETYIDDQSWCTLTRHDATCILSQMSQALFHLHQMGMVHDDMKPDNIIYSPDHRHSTLIDFGAAYSELVKPAGYFNTSGTPPYAPPEYLRRIKGKKGDVWGLGVTMLFLMKEVELPAGEWILPHALEGEDRPRKEMVTWLKRVEGVRVGLGERKGVMGGLVGAMLEAEPDERIGSGGLVDRLDALQGRVIWEESLKHSQK